MEEGKVSSEAASSHFYKQIWTCLETRVRSLVVSDLRSETKGSRFESGRYLYAEVRSLQQSPG